MLFHNTRRFLSTTTNSTASSSKYLALAQSSINNNLPPDTILSHLDQAKKLNPTLESVDFLRALAFIKKNDAFSARQAVLEELRHHPKNIEAQNMARGLRSKFLTNNSNDGDENNGILDLPNEIKVKEPEFAMCYNALLDHTMLDAVRLLNLFQSSRDVFCHQQEEKDKNTTGLIVECGTAGGGSLVMMGCGARLSLKNNRGLKLVSFDTFQGMPAASNEKNINKKDRIINNNVSAEDSHWADGTCCSGSEEHVQRLARTFGFGKDIVETVPGLFCDTLPKYFANDDDDSSASKTIKMLHIDCDWYESTKDCLNYLWPRLEVGGRFQIDDFLYWDGCKKAVEEYFATLPNPPKCSLAGVALVGTKV